MLEDRDYMRPDFQPRGPRQLLALPGSILVIIALTVAFALQQIDLVYGHGSRLDESGFER